LGCFAVLFVDAALKNELGVELGNRPGETRTSEKPTDRRTQYKRS